MCMIVFVGGLLDAKNAQVTGESKNFEGPKGGKKHIGRGAPSQETGQ